MKKVAVFDIDGTIFRSSLLIELVDGLTAEGIFDPNVRKIFLKKKGLWITRKGSYGDYIDAVIKVFTENLKGVSFTDFDRVGTRVVKMNRDRVYRFTRDLIKELKKKHYYLLAVSQSPKRLLDEFCKTLGFDKVYGRFYELGPNDKFTGEVVDLHLIANKANIVKRVVAKEGLTLKDSIGVGDTEGDISFLELVENPICFNPNEKLLRWARRNKHRVVVERKDVVYEIGM